MELALAEAASFQYVLLNMFSEYLEGASPLTPRGRVRAALNAYHAALDRFDRLALRLGLQRRPGWQQAHREIDSYVVSDATPHDNVDDDIDVDDIDDNNEDDRDTDD
jgi:hypothetical protein